MRRHRPGANSGPLAAFALASLSLVCGPALSQAADGSSGAELLRKFLDETRTLRAEFRQQLVGPDSEILESAIGELSIRRPGQFAWHYAQPLEQLVVADGKNLWIYDAELAQATVTSLADAAPASPAMLLSGEASLDAEFDVIESFEAEELSWVRLAPKPMGADFKEVLIGFQAGTLRELRLLDSLDQVTMLEFSDIEVNPTLADATFQFVPPPGVDVIGEPG